MAYHEISIMDIWDVIRRFHSGTGIREITRSLGYDRKTIQRYIRLAASHGLSRERPLPAKEEVLEILRRAETPRGRSAQRQALLEPYREEIAELVNHPHHPVKLKTAFLIVCQRHELTDKISYTSFKRFARTHEFSLNPERTTCRIEVPPGSEVQIDYARIGMLYDPLAARVRTLYAFIATLAHSRFKYIEPTFKQDQKSFVSSHIRMFKFFGGVPLRVNLDNLKSGVIKPDLYDPVLNRSYREMAEHYACFIDPARVRSPKDKGKVERDVPTVREALRMQLHLNPMLTIGELTRLIRQWSSDEYGQKKHGTTHEKPYEVFCQRERPALLPLPAEDFDIAVWKQATVHPDHYIQFQNKAYSVPHACVGKTVWVRATEHIVEVFFQNRLVATHVIGKGYRHTDYTHFPDNVRAALDTNTLHKSLLERALEVGSDFGRMVRSLLEVHAYVNLRCALGLVDIAKRTGNNPLVERAAGLMHQHHIKATPKNLRHVLERLSSEHSVQQTIPLSDASREFVRDISYFINTHEGNA